MDSEFDLPLRDDDTLTLTLDGWEGPLDLLLTLARAQKVDLAQISILALTDQYIAYIDDARALKLEVAADYLVMAAWLAYLKSCLLLPKDPEVDPSPEELAQLTGLSVDVVQSLAALNTGDVRLDAPMDPEGDRSLIERFVADEMPDTEEEAMNRFLNDEIEQALNTLPPRDAKVLRLYFGLEGGREHTLEEIGSMLGVTRERVRQLRDRALKRLREGDVGRALGSFAA